ncbi:MAG: hypothetical protein HKO98_03030, partial [Gemmatimonadetes bacterium]|nr:hypothetical protein [Gemmatimonadota bacterium]
PVRTFPHTPEAVPAWSVEPAPVLEIGAVTGEGPAVFSRVGAVRLTEGGGVVVTDELAGEIREFGPDGSHRGSMGGSGEGPGEFGNSIALPRIAGDTVYAWDGRVRRLSIFVGGEFDHGWIPPSEGAVSDVTLVRDRLYGQSTVSFSGLPETGLSRPGTRYGILEPDGSYESFFEVAGPERYIDIQTSGGSISAIAVFQTPFARGAFFTVAAAATHDRILGGPNDRFVLHEWDSRDGALIGVHRYPGLDDLVTESDVERARDRIRERFDEPDARMRTELETLADNVPEYAPAFDRIWPDDAGRLWLRHTAAEDGEEWFVFGLDDLTPLARLTLPAGFALMDVREGLLAGRWQDALDIAYVRVHRLRMN